MHESLENLREEMLCQGNVEKFCMTYKVTPQQVMDITNEILTEWELDTQEKKTLEESAWIKCKPYYNEEWQGEPDYEEDFLPKWEDDHYWNGEPKYPERSIEDAWEFIDWFEDPDNPSIMKETSYLEEIMLENEWLTHEGTNYQEWKECEEEIRKRKSAILLDELNSMLVELLKQ